MRTRLLLSLLGLTALALPACNKDTPTGSLVVPFEIGAGVPCATLMVRDIDVELWSMPADGDVPDMVETVTVACDDGEAVFNNVPVGNYTIVARGNDADGITVVDNDGNDPDDEGEVLSGAENTADTIALSPTPARVYVRWKINDGFEQCTDVSLATLEVSTYKNAGSQKQFGYTFACDAMSDPEVKGYRLVVDEGRAIEGAEIDLIRIVPQDMAGDSIGNEAKFTLAPPGPGRTIKLTIDVTCDDTTCDLSCALDPMDPNMELCTPDA